LDAVEKVSLADFFPSQPFWSPTTHFPAAMATQALTSNLPQTRPREPPNTAPRVSGHRQVRKLTENLLNTYREINEAYYKCVYDWLQGCLHKRQLLRRKKQERNKEKEGQKDTEFEIKEGQVLHNRYRVQTSLGKGSFGQVGVAPAFHTLGGLSLATVICRSSRRLTWRHRAKLL
jgi:hypothetical protein